MKKRAWLIAAVGLFVLFVLSLPAEAHGFRFSFGVSFGFGRGYYSHPYAWYGPAYYPRTYVRYAYIPYQPVTVVRHVYPYRVYRTHSPRPAGAIREYGNYVPRRYTRAVYGPAYPRHP